MISARSAAPLAALCLLPSLAAAQVAPGAPLPTAQAVVARYVDAIGGRAALERLPPRWERGRVEIAAQGLTLIWESLSGGGRTTTRSELPGFGTIRTGFDGTVAWSLSPASGPMILEGLAAEQVRQAADPLAALHPDRYVSAMQTVEETDFAGSRCYRVRVTAPWGESYDEFYDVGTGLLQGYVRQQASPQGNMEITSEIAEYRSVGGVRLPRVIRARLMGMQMVNTVDTAEVRPVADSVFALPPEIRALRGGS